MIDPKDLSAKAENTWCPGCPNFMILQAFKEVVAELDNENKIKIENTAIVTGIGCHAKIFDYVNINSFSGLHGRVLPILLGTKLSNPNLKVVGFGGDGDTFSEGASHFIHSCRRNADLTMLVHDNQVFALTVGQPTPTSEIGFLDGYPPPGVIDHPLNPIALALISGATFVARASALDKEHLKVILKQAIEHKGFSFVDILQPCIIFHNVVPYFQKNIYKLDETYSRSDFKGALEKALEWDYCFDKGAKIPIGVFYQIKKPTLEEQLSVPKIPWHKVERKIDWEGMVGGFKS
ncbi:MAG: thiamine pyrophosphate-dependent enzyme [Candidatus Wildermuthbacteria bacterium]|nr:thiamine pyrophosphate-dependent enzyme [Candidatus Wildermuthbacteria bacterium]